MTDVIVLGDAYFMGNSLKLTDCCWEFGWRRASQQNIKILAKLRVGKDDALYVLEISQGI